MTERINEAKSRTSLITNDESTADYATRKSLEAAKKRVFEHKDRPEMDIDIHLDEKDSNPEVPSKSTVRGEYFLLKMIKNAKGGRSDEEITRDVERVIEEVQNEPRSGIYFDPAIGHVTPDDYYDSDVSAELKTMLGAINVDKESDLCEQVEVVISSNWEIIRHGKTTHDKKNCTWFVYESNDELPQVLISWKYRGDTWDDCHVDAVPFWLLLSILLEIRRHMRLGQQDVYDVIDELYTVESRFIREKQVETIRDYTLNTRRRE